MSEDEISHYGIRGMRWGVRKDEDLVGKKPSGKQKETSKKEWIDLAEKSRSKRISPEKAEREFQKNQEKWLKKFDDPGEKKGSGAPKKAKIDKALKEDEKERGIDNGSWRPTKKQVAVTATGAVLAAGIAYGIYRHKTNPNPEAATALVNRLRGKKPSDVDIEDFNPGKFKSDNKPFNQLLKGKFTPNAPITAQEFNGRVSFSKQHTWWGQGFITKKSFDQEEYTLKAGHIFRRLSTSAETQFHGATYTTDNLPDWHRYLTNFRHEKLASAKFHEITFRAKEDIRVPSLTQRLTAMKRVLGTNDDAKALEVYKSLCGGPWSSTTAKKLFAVLESEGFGAIVDDMDAGVIGDSPLVLFKTSAVTDKVATPIGKAVIEAAEAAVLELANRKP